MQNSIIGYLLGALDDDEMAKFEAQLKNDPQLQAQVREASRKLQCLKDEDDIEPPLGLADSTCAMVEELRQSGATIDPTELDVGQLELGPIELAYQSEPVHPERGVRGMRPAMAIGSGGQSEWTLTDAFVACCVVLAACLLFFPAIYNSRYHAQITGCQNNLRTIGQALIAYSGTDSKGLFPQVPQDGNMAFAGMYAPTLKSFGLVEDDSLFRCAVSSLGFRKDTSEDAFRVPTIEEIEQSRGEDLYLKQCTSGGDYGYSLGFVFKGQVKGIRNRSRNHFALMSDTPTLYKLLIVRPRNRSNVHRNVLFESGSVRVVCIDTDCWYGDQLYTNDFGQVSAGVHESDAVIAASATAPMVRAVSYRTP